VLVELAADPDVHALLAEHGLNGHDLPALVAAHEPRLEREPADWYHRLEQRGLGDGPVQRMLAILRSADCTAHQLLEAIGVPTARLRKAAFDHLRSRPAAAVAPSGARQAPARKFERTHRRAHPRAAGDVSGPPSSPSVASRGARAARAHGAGQRDAHAQLDSEPESLPTPELRSKPAPRPLDPDDLAPLHGRTHELEILADAVMRQSVRPPLLVGERGSGRTLVARHLARRIGKPVYLLRASDYDDDDGLRADLDVVCLHGGVAIFDDLDRVSSDLPPPFLTALAQSWAQARPRTVTVVSHETRARLAAWMPGVLDGLDLINIEPPAERDVFEAVKLAAPAVLERHGGLALADDTNLTDLSRAADRYLVGLGMPGRALDLLDLACARARREGRDVVDAETWTRVVCERTGLPANRVRGTGNHDVLELEAHLARQVVGHTHVLETLADLIRRNRAGFSSGRPIATSLLLGPSGVGKTEIAKALAGALFDRDDALLRLDMSEYSEPHSVARVVGAPPGYVGHEHGGALTDPLLAQPHRVVLLDEIEKAHRDVHQLLLQVLDEGRLTDGRGRTVDFRHSVLVMTSNLGAGHLERPTAIFGVDRDDVDAAVLEEARDAFPVELWNRIEAPLVLRPLDAPALAKICVRLAKASSDRLLAERGIQYKLDQTAIALLVALAGSDRALGARPLRHMLTRRVEAMLADEILRGRLRAGARVTVSRRDDDLVVSRLA